METEVEESLRLWFETWWVDAPLCEVLLERLETALLVDEVVSSFWSQFGRRL